MNHRPVCTSRPLRAFATAFGMALLLGGCATAGDPRDPLEPLNRGIYQFNDAVDKALLKPVASGYRTVVPEVVRTGVNNFFSNIGDILIAANNLLQLKVPEALSDVGRVAVNSTIGIFGLFDPATSMGLEKHNEDFGQTLGRWGVGSGPYLVLPLLGPSSVRDGMGRVVDAHYDPLINSMHDVEERNRVLALRIIDARSRLLDAEKVLDEAALDPYAFVRDAYLQRRLSQVYDGKPPREEDEENGDTAPQAPAPGPRGEAPAATLSPAPQPRAAASLLPDSLTADSVSGLSDAAPATIGGADLATAQQLQLTQPGPALPPGWLSSAGRRCAAPC